MLLFVLLLPLDLVGEVRVSLPDHFRFGLAPDVKAERSSGPLVGDLATAGTNSRERKREVVALQKKVTVDNKNQVPE